MAEPPVSFYEAGAVTSQIDVEISLQIIGLFSEGLYSSPNKAIEELVSNSFDADASCVHVTLSADRAAPDASIAVLDNGSGMDGEGLKVHWIVGDSRKSRNRATERGRRTIGKFGIGKLAAYVLGERLTHITKANGKYFSTSMDFRNIPRTADVNDLHSSAGSLRRGPVRLDLRELSEADARAAVCSWLTDADGRTELRLFGNGSSASWTVAIISDLKPMATDLTAGRLRWVLSTAMPLRDDFKLYLNSERIVSSKNLATAVGSWVLGKEVQEIPKPAPADLESNTDERYDEDGYRHWTLTDTLLGPLTGYVEVYEDPIDSGKSSYVGRSNGFFVYVHGRLINPEDAGFGIDRNSLRHGTFSRFRVVVNMDRLDAELRSSRETVRDSPMLERARDILQGLFNYARGRLNVYEVSISTERLASRRLSDSPASLTERPILRLLLDTFDGAFAARHLSSVDRSHFKGRGDLLAHVEARIKRGEGLVSEVHYADLGTQLPMAVLDAVTGFLSINLEHPFVAHFADAFGDSRKNLPLQLFAISEILLEAELNNAEIDSSAVNLVLDSRDELLRALARSSGAQNSLTVAQDLVNSASNAKDLEVALVNAFSQLGFEAVPKAGNDEPDGLAEAFLPGGDSGTRHYRVSLEAKSKEKPGGKVKKKAVEVATIARHRKEANCDHAIVVGPDFETGPDDLGAVVREIDADREANAGKTITLMRIADLAKLVRIAPVRRTNLSEIRRLLISARTPEEAAAWVAALENAEVEPAPYPAILEQVWTIQQDDKEHGVEYGSLRTALRMSGRLRISDADLRVECAALSRMAPNLFFARDDRVELNIRPDKVLDVIHDYIDRLPAENA